MAGTLVRLEGVSRHYGPLRALDRVDLSIRAGEWLAVMGPSGSGKSTLVNLLGALDQPTAGRVVVDGVEITALPEAGRVRFRREKVGIIFQQFHLFPYLTALENVMVAQHYHSVADAGEARRALERVDLADRAQHLPSQLSGGEQQRVCVARALINQPKLILADEPTGNLDADNEDRVLRLLRELHAEGHTLVTVTHAPGIGNLADRRVELHHGRLADLTVHDEEIERRYDEVLVQVWALLEDGRLPEARRVKVPDVVDNERTLQGMEESGLVTRPGTTLELTGRGRERARDLVRRRRLAEVLFTSALHLPRAEVELAACRMEHIIDPEVTNSICGFLGHPRHCPHGRPIPVGDCCELPIIS
ncbi:MAG: ATP-binding cassette domain-containing protein [Candidatus Eisenbacteria bacterium]|nr:ATP-binding cassette domain-containing protein [Candidatus Eisenbacteria bacterium]